MAEIGLLLCLVLAALSLVLWVLGAAIVALANFVDWVIGLGKRKSRASHARPRPPLAPRYPRTGLGSRPYDYLLIDAARQYFHRVEDRRQELLAALPHDHRNGQRALDDFYLARARELATLGFMVGRIVGSREAEDDDLDGPDHED